MSKQKKVIKQDKKENKFLGKFIKLKMHIIKHFKLLSFIFLGIVLVLFLVFLFKNKALNTKIITIDDVTYTKSDYNIYYYSAKYNYFGASKTNITDDDLKVVYDKDTNVTVGDYLKEVTLSDIKTQSAVRKLANDNNIELSDSDLEKIKQEKERFISALGGKKAYKKFLKDNNTTDKSYNKMSEVDFLYRKIIEKLYSEKSINDLTDEELEQSKESYKNNYFKIKQIILTIIDLNTGKSLNSTAINQKKTLAKNIVDEAQNADFDELIKKYSEDSTDKEPPYDLYYKKGELLEELEEVVINLQEGEVSTPIKTQYAYHIIKKEPLDDEKYNDYLNELRENKCIEVLKKLIDDEKIIYHDAYKKI